jgi:uncharacterized protein (TIGR03435 family)
MRAALFLLFSSTLLPAQTFEVATVKINNSGSPASAIPNLYKGRLKYTNATMHQILQIAWGVTAPQITGPSWIDSDRYDVDAKSPDGVPDTEVKPMLQALLKERFALDAHIEMRESALYNPVVMKDGPKHPDSAVRIPGAQGRMVGGRIDGLTSALSGVTGRPVFNKTGLAGAFDYAVQWAAVDHSNEPDGVPDIFGAVQQQLGLKLESAKAPVETLVVDRADRVPSGN